MRSAGNIFFPARFWLCTSRRNWSRLRRDFWRLCLVVCSIKTWSALRNKYLLSKAFESYLADAAAKGCLALAARRRSVVHLILPLYGRCCKFRLLDSLLTFSAHHIAVCGCMFQKSSAPVGWKSWQKFRCWLMATDAVVGCRRSPPGLTPQA
jgi:hypothetical protein